MFEEALDDLAERAETRSYNRLDAPEARPKMSQAEQSAAFEHVAKEHGAEGSEKDLNGVPRKLAAPLTKDHVKRRI